MNAFKDLNRGESIRPRQHPPDRPQQLPFQCEGRIQKDRKLNLIVRLYQTEYSGYNIPEDIKLSSKVVSDNFVQKAAFSASNPYQNFKFPSFMNPKTEKFQIKLVLPLLITMALGPSCIAISILSCFTIVLKL